MPKLSDIKKKSKANNSLKTDVRIGLIDDSISEIFTIDIEKPNLIKDKFHQEAKDHDTSKKQQINTTSKTADKLNIKKESFTSTSIRLETKDRTTDKTKDNLDRQLSTKKASFNSNNQNESTDISTDKTTDSLISASNHNSPIDIKNTELNNLSTSQHKNLEQLPTLITKKTKDNTTDKEINLSHKTNHKQSLKTNKTTDITKDSLATLSYHNSKIKPDDCKAKLNTSSNFQHESHQQFQKLHPQETTDIYTDKTTDVRTTPFQETQQENPFPITKTKDISADTTKDILKKHLPNETNENSEASAKTNITSRDSNHNSQMVTENLISPSNIADQTINFNGMPDSHHEELNDLNKAQTKETANKTTDNTKDKISQLSMHNTLIVEKPHNKTTDTSKDIQENANLYQGQTADVQTRTTDKLETHPRTPQRTELRTRLNYQNIPERSYSELSKLQQKIIKTLYISCVQSSGTITQKITINYLIDQTQSSAESIKRTIRRLMRENFLDKYEWKDGRGGWTKYELHPYFYKSLFGIVGIKTEDMSADINTDKPGTHPRTTPPSSSISFNNINKELTTNEYPFNPVDVPGQQQLGPQFDSDWQTIDITPLASIGFSNNHLSQLFTKNELTPKQVQESINAFAFDLEENKRGEKIKTSPLNLFMGILKGGSPYNPPKNYESDEDRLLREQVEAEREKLEKRQQMQAELKELKYQNWLLDLSIEKKLDILDVPQAFFEKMPIEAIQEGLKKHFEMKVL